MGNVNSNQDIKAKIKHSASFSNLNKKFNIYDKCNNLSNCDSIRRKKKSVSTSNLAHIRSKSADLITKQKTTFLGKLFDA